MKKTLLFPLILSLSATLSLQANGFTDAFNSTKKESKKVAKDVKKGSISAWKEVKSGSKKAWSDTKKAVKK